MFRFDPERLDTGYQPPKVPTADKPFRVGRHRPITPATPPQEPLKPTLVQQGQK